jgi:LPS-assembly lipoprotein
MTKVQGTPMEMPMQPKRRVALRAALATALAPLALSACGFQLRGSTAQANIPFSTIYLAIPDTSPLGIELKRNLRAGNGTQIVDAPNKAQAVIELLNETRDNSTVVSRNTQGRIREYQLQYKVTFDVKNGKGAQLLAPTEILLKRNISFNESQVLAKEREEELLYRDMQTDLVQQILRRLAVLKPA